MNVSIKEVLPKDPKNNTPNSLDPKGLDALELPNPGKEKSTGLEFSAFPVPITFPDWNTYSPWKDLDPKKVSQLKTNLENYAKLNDTQLKAVKKEIKTLLGIPENFNIRMEYGDLESSSAIKNNAVKGHIEVAHKGETFAIPFSLLFSEKTDKMMGRIANNQNGFSQIPDMCRNLMDAATTFRSLYPSQEIIDKGVARNGSLLLLTAKTDTDGQIKYTLFSIRDRVASDQEVLSVSFMKDGGSLLVETQNALYKFPHKNPDLLDPQQRPRIRPIEIAHKLEFIEK